MSDNLTIHDIEKVAIVVQLNGKCHQVLINSDDKKAIINFIGALTGGLKLSAECLPLEFELKKENPNV